MLADSLCQDQCDTHSFINNKCGNASTERQIKTAFVPKSRLLEGSSMSAPQNYSKWICYFLRPEIIATGKLFFPLGNRLN